MWRLGASCLFDEPAPGPWACYSRLPLFQKPIRSAMASCLPAMAVRSPPARGPEMVKRNPGSRVGEAIQEKRRHLPPARGGGLVAPLLNDRQQNLRLRPPRIHAQHPTFGGAK